MNRPLTECDDALYRDAAAYRATHGDRWSEEAVKDLKRLSEQGCEPAIFERWVEMINIMNEMSQPKH